MAMDVLGAAIVIMWVAAEAVEAEWCVARSEAGREALQAALDYACGAAAAADCLPIQPSGLCYLPNSLPAHASYAFNSFFQRSAAAPAACDFAGTATITVTDPSYGSCTYPSTTSTAGGSVTNPGSNTATTSGGGGNGGGGVSSDLGTPLADTESSGADALSVYLLLCTILPVFLLPKV